MSMEDIQRATMAQRGLSQFEKMHQPVESRPDYIECITCGEDWPCERMSVVLISQSISALMRMLPTGNMQSVLQRFSQSQPQS